MLSLYFLDERFWKRWRAAAKECQRRLTDQQIVPGDPGTILKDIDTIIEFIGPGGIVSKSRNATLPAERLPELNAKMSHPVELALKRALLKDYPNLAGIFILLRVLELLHMRAGRLAPNPAAIQFWRSLNPAEQYFALLEALLFQAQSLVLGGERRRSEDLAIETVPFFLGQLSDRWRTFKLYEASRDLGPTGKIPPWNLFVQQQMGLLELRPENFSAKERAYSGGRGWLAGAARLTPWGMAVTWALLEFLDKQEQEAEKPDQEAQSEQEDEAFEEPRAAAQFGMLQPVFQPYFPEWQTVYAGPKRHARLGTHIFKATLTGWRGGRGGIWRRLAIPASADLEDLARAILEAFKLDNDHLYDFLYRDESGKRRRYNHPYTDEGPYLHEITVGESGLPLKGEMDFTFDYGAHWEFKVRLEAVDRGPSEVDQPQVIESAGEPPSQYPPAE
jgi:hypothetical protein